MGVYVVAIQCKYNCYYRFRMVDSNTGQVRMLKVEDVFRYMANAMKPFKVEHMKIDYAKDTFAFKGFDSSRVCRILDNDEPRCNETGMVVTKIDGDYVYLANYKGQIIKVHMLQVGNSVKARKAFLVNADILENGRIVMRDGW